MEMVACPRCGSQFDVSSFQPGAAFTCGACGNVLQVPARTGPPAAPPVAPAAAPAPAAPRRTGDRRRAGGAAAKGEGRAERIRRQREEGGAGRKKNPLPLVLALVAVVALGGLAAAKFLGGRDAPPKEGDGAAGAGGGGDAKGETARLGPSPVPSGGEGGAGSGPGEGGAGSGTATNAGPGDPGRGSGSPEAAPDFESMEDSRKLAVIESKVASARRGMAEARSAVEWLEGKGLKEDARRALEGAREKFPDDPWINGRLGLVDRTREIRKMAMDDEILFLPASPEQERLLALHGRLADDPGAGWLDAEVSARLDADIAVLEEQRRASKDPVAARTYREYTNQKLSPLFTEVDFTFKSARPYVIFVENPSPDRKAEAERKVERFAECLVGVYGAYLEFLRKDLGLDAPRAEDLADHRFRVFVFRNRASFDAWHNRTGQEIPQFAGAYYQHGGDHMIMMHGDQEGVDTTMHEATHQLMHFYSRHFCQLDDDRIAAEKGEPKEEVRMDDSRLRSAFFWFQEGIAEYFGNSEKGPDGTWKPGGIDRNHLGFFRQMRATKLAWTVPEFVFADQGELRALVKSKGGGLAPELFNSVAYSQGWSLVHYFRHGENGKWRDKFHEFVRRELRGYSDQHYLTDAFGLGKKTADPKVGEWMEEIDKAYVRYVEGLR